MSNTPMAQPMRALLGATSALAKLNVGPTMESFIAKPHAERIAHKNPGLMTRRVTALIDTEDVHVKLFKDIPRMDLEMLLPGTRVKMSLVDRTKIVLPTLSGLGLTLWKVCSGAVIVAASGM